MITANPDTEVGLISSEEPVFNDSHFRVVRRIIKTDHGTREHLLWDRIGKESVIVVAITDNNEVIFIIEPKYGVLQKLLVLPAGGIERDESPIEAAKRELMEETGYASENWTLVRSGIIDFADKIDGGEHYFCLATGAKKQKIPLEDCEVVLIPVNEMPGLITEHHRYILKTAMSISCLAVSLLETKQIS